MVVTVRAMRRLFRAWLAGALVWVTSGCASFDYPSEEGPLPPDLAAKRLSWDRFDDQRLATAIFAETNRVRREHDLPRLRETADLQAYTVAVTGVATHHNPLAGRAGSKRLAFPWRWRWRMWHRHWRGCRPPVVQFA
ncbi:hypothetical protein [Synoicihabitans lomoniglobus]|nr:hypothetical protein [Opitutaceae bacterium LMO-M01]